MKKAYLLLPVALVALSGCAIHLSVNVSSGDTGQSSSSSVVERDVNWISPVGAPALAFYDQGANQNWTSTSATTSIPANFKTDTYDAIVFDGVNGLKQIQNAGEDSSYVLAMWLTGGNFHLVSTKHTAEEVPTDDSTFLSFNEGSLPDSVFKKLAADHWGWDITFTSGQNITYVDGTSTVSNTLAASPDAYDYYFIAEPSLTSAKSKLSGTTVNEIYDLRAQWKEFSDQDAIPQAGLFVHKDHYDSDKAGFDAWLEHIRDNVKTAYADGTEAADAINAYSSDATEQSARFGFNATLVGNLQASGKNRFGLTSGEEIDNASFLNEFYKKLTDVTEDTFKASLFL